MFGLAGVVLLLGADAYAAEPTPSPETLARGMQDRSERVETLQGQATLRAWFSDHEITFRREKWQEPGLGRVGLVRFAFWIAGDRWRIETLELIGSGDSLLADWPGAGEDPQQAGPDQPRRYSCCVSDGELIYEYRSPPRPSTAKHFCAAERQNPKIRLLREMLLLPDAAGYAEALAQQQKVTVVGPTELAGERVYLLRLINPLLPAAGRGETAVCIDKGFAGVAKRSFSGSPSDPESGYSRGYRTSGLYDAGGQTWLPTETRLDAYRFPPPANGDPWAYTWMMSFDELRVNEPVDADPAAFRMPLGAYVTDRLVGDTEWAGLGGALTALEALRRAPDPPAHDIAEVRPILPRAVDTEVW
jgi:hypothetical protein